MKKNTITSPRPKAVHPPELINRFRNLVLPLGGTEFHVLRGLFWQPQKWSDGNWKKLDDHALDRHLQATDYTVSTRWSLHGLARHAVIDLDSPIKHVRRDALLECPELVATADEEMAWNLLDVLTALGFPPHAVFRSSASRGLHVYLYFDRLHASRTIHDAVVERLTSAGLAPGDGIVDKVFPSNQALRLPLGPDSCLLDDTDLVSWATTPRPAPKLAPGCRTLRELGEVESIPSLEVVGATEIPLPIASTTVESYAHLGLGAPPVGPVRVVCDLRASLDALARLAKNRVSIETLVRAGGVLDKGGKRGGAGSAGAGPAASANTVATPTSHVATSAPSIGRMVPRASSLPTMLQDPAHDGQRYRQRTAIILALYRSGMDQRSAMMQFEGWLKLSATSGTSKQLRGAGPETIASHLQDGLGFWNWLVQKGVLPVGASGGHRVVALSTVAALPPRSLAQLSSPPPLSSTPPPAWNRAKARRSAKPKDEARLSAIACEWVREKAAVLVGLLRMAESQHGPLTQVTIGAQVLDRVIGGRGAPKEVAAMHIDPKTRRPRSGRDIVLSELASLGYLFRIDDGVWKKRASLFDVALP